jgi:archaellum component FlaC
MKGVASRFIILAFFFASTMILSCSEEERKPQAPVPHEEETIEHTNETIQNNGERFETEGELTAEQKEAYIDRVQEQMLVMEENIQELKVKAKTLQGESREKMDRKLDELDALYEKASSDLSDLKDQGTKAWFEVRQNLEDSLYQLELAYQDARGLE